MNIWLVGFVASVLAHVVAVWLVLLIETAERLMK